MSAPCAGLRVEELAKHAAPACGRIGEKQSLQELRKRQSGSHRTRELQWSHAIAALEVMGERALIVKARRDGGVADRLATGEIPARRVEPQLRNIGMRRQSGRVLEQPDELILRKLQPHTQFAKRERLGKPCMNIFGCHLEPSAVARSGFGARTAAAVPLEQC